MADYRYDSHHCLWPRADYSKGYAKVLRQYWYFIVKVPRETVHSAIHQEIGCVPVPPGGVAKEAYKHLIMLENYGVLHPDDPIERRLELLASLFDYAYQPTADALRKQKEIVHRFSKRPP